MALVDRFKFCGNEIYIVNTGTFKAAETEHAAVQLTDNNG
jgi:hypothetical protein